MITEITPEQEAKFPQYVEEWTKVGLSTEPVDEPKAIAAIKLAYTLVGLKEPTKFYTVDSPQAAIKFIKTLDPSKSENTILSEMIYGSGDAYWIAFYEFMRKEMGVKDIDQIEGLSQLSRVCGWLNVYEDVVVFQHRPKSIKFDDQNRLHCQDGPAIEYRDGYSVYAWHGTRVPAEWIKTPGHLTAKMALTWENVEQRRCACEILGWVNILKELDAVVIDQDVDPEIGTLVEVDIPEIGREKFLRVLCGTKREFALPVPPEMKTALEANAWTYNIPMDVMKSIEVRT